MRHKILATLSIFVLALIFASSITGEVSAQSPRELLKNEINSYLDLIETTFDDNKEVNFVGGNWFGLVTGLSYACPEKYRELRVREDGIRGKIAEYLFYKLRLMNETYSIRDFGDQFQINEIIEFQTVILVCGEENFERFVGKF